MSTYLRLPSSPVLGTTTSNVLRVAPARTEPDFLSGADDGDIQNVPLIAFCHLGWDWVWQRPQQFLSRLAKTHPVLFVEWSESKDITKPVAQLRTAPGHPAVTILHGCLPAGANRSNDDDDDACGSRMRRELVLDVLAREFPGEFIRPILWFYDPMVVHAFAGRMDERAIVYDCMDELSQFHGAPPELLSCERALLRAADVVFCGGRGMREKRLPLNPNCHFFGTGVDCTHFGQALSPELPVAREIAALRKPVLGYFGVVDERIDYELLAQLADTRSDWSVVLVGPFAKVDPAQFPRRPNLHFLGGRNYADLPAITKGFDVSLMPFALNAATEYINPTKALEYMAAGKPVVSTAIQEVKLNFASVAAIAGSRDEFVALCQREVTAPSRRRIARGLRLAAQNTWEQIIQRMEALMAEAIQQRAASERRPAAVAAGLQPVSAT